MSIFALNLELIFKKIKNVEELTENYNRNENQFHVNGFFILQLSHVTKNHIPNNFAYRNFFEIRGCEIVFRNI